jgi:cytochrome c peroxidase
MASASVPEDDQITSKLQALQFYQLAIPSPQPPAGTFDAAGAARGDVLFSGKAKCNNCHVEPLWSDPGWNLHTPAEMCIDSFQADRAPDHRYRTAPIGALFTHAKGGFYHDGRFSTLGNVVDHYNTCLALGLTGAEKKRRRAIRSESDLRVRLFWQNQEVRKPLS